LRAPAGDEAGQQVGCEPDGVVEKYGLCHSHRSRAGLMRRIHMSLCSLKPSTMSDSVAKPTAAIVDDSRLSRRMLRDILERNGYVVTLESATTADIVDACASHAPDVVILDSRTAGIHWPAALQNLRGRVPHVTILDLKELSADEIESAVLKLARATELRKPLN
jgi:two-component system chemotaxis response regulator CheY